MFHDLIADAEFLHDGQAVVDRVGECAVGVEADGAVAGGGGGRDPCENVVSVPGMGPGQRIAGDRVRHPVFRQGISEGIHGRNVAYGGDRRVRQAAAGRQLIVFFILPGRQRVVPGGGFVPCS